MEQIAIYLRLSKEDEFVKDESNSIINQRAFIRGFINKNKELRKMSVVEFVDDGYSGKNMDRPDMQRMLELVKRKQISCVIVKDFSRFSRDHIEQGKYIEQIFPFMGVRFIAINDNYADGRDVSWLWDAEFELLNDVSKSIVVSGTRAEDMALRLKYAGVEVNKINI